VEGINVSPLSPALKRRYSLADDVTAGLVVTEVAPRSKAGRDRHARGTVITRAFGRLVSTPQEFKAAVDAARAAGRSQRASVCGCERQSASCAAGAFQG
jgi:serine protease Do